MRPLKKRSVTALSEAYKHACLAQLHLKKISEDCEGFDQFDKASLTLIKVGFYLNHTIYAAKQLQEEQS